ncbi:hypothetical protein F511_18830 [Dorcoceras hygrometricum]|uniref:Uncharacterized protein n=1 Tax=Dorcoceras hygrometricum TaxID=472368 RepID=A0A2Z7CVN4_9LAMI|nr:hypothetical protein F511_18830 [Dorcoceras hygrometricum]
MKKTVKLRMDSARETYALNSATTAAEAAAVIGGGIICGAIPPELYGFSTLFEHLIDKMYDSEVTLGNWTPPSAGIGADAIRSELHDQIGAAAI